MFDQPALQNIHKVLPLADCFLDVLVLKTDLIIKSQNKPAWTKDKKTPLFLGQRIQMQDLNLCLSSSIYLLIYNNIIIVNIAIYNNIKIYI